MPEYVTVLEVEHFDPVALDLYWRFLTERQCAWVRRVHFQMPWPWSQDPILQSEFITNVYRILDPGTQYLIENILSYRSEDDLMPTMEDVLFNVMLYRLMGSVPSTHQHLGFQMCEDFHEEAFAARLAELPDDYRIFGDAYRVASYTQEGSDKKVENIAKMFAYFAGGMPETVRRVQAAREVVEVYRVFEQMKGFGEFLAHQIVVDLLYPNKWGSKVADFSEDEFAKAGPGARKGIWTLIREGVKPANMTIVMEWLRDQQVAAFEERNLPFPFLADAANPPEPDDVPLLMSLCDIQASLCEFYKYYRLWSGERAAQVRKYDPSRSRTLEASHAVCMPLIVLNNIQDTCFTYQRAEEDTREALLDAEEPSGTSSEVLDGDEPYEGGKDEPASVYFGKERVEAGTSTLEFSPAPGLNVQITINFNLGKEYQ